MEKLFLMRWDPAISSCKLETYHRNCEEFPDGYRTDWSIWDANRAHVGDRFVMMRVGDYKPGIIYYGNLSSEPFAGDDWAGSDKKRMYVMMDCFGWRQNDDPIISAEVLNAEIRGVDWMHGHSGVVLPADVDDRLEVLLRERIPDFTYFPDDDYEEDFTVEKLNELAEKYHHLKPSIHTHDEDGYDWLDDDEYSRCLVIPNPNPNGQDIEVASNYELTLYFAGSHAHFTADEEGYEDLCETIDAILTCRECAYTCIYDGWSFIFGLGSVEPTENSVRQMLTENDEYDIRMLAEYTDRDVKPDGIYCVDLIYFNPEKDRKFSFRLDQVTANVDKYRKRQDEVKKS